MRTSIQLVIGEEPLKSVWLQWDATEDQHEREVAAEMVGALTTFVDGWLDPLAVEARVGCYDREIFTETANLPAQPYHILVRATLPEEVVIRPRYHAIEQRVPALSREAVERWLGAALGQSCGAPTRFEPSLRELLLRTLRLPAPASLASTGALALQCYAGTVTIPLDHDGDRIWVGIPPARLVLPPPLTLPIDNNNEWCHLSIDLYGSPWIDELARPDSPLALAIGRLAARGWRPSED